MSAEVTSTTRDAIMETALQLFTAQGYDATSLRQIADRLGFTKAALYYHFPAKDHLVIELTRPWLDAISNLLTMHQQDGGAGEREQQDRFLADYTDLCITHHAVLCFLSQDVAAMKHPDVGKRARTLILALKDVLAGPDADDADRVRAACAVATVHALATLDATALAAARSIVSAAASAALRPQDTEAAGRST